MDRGGTFTDLVALPRNGPLVAPMVAIHTVAAGAAPGPAAYRRGGPATLSDANVVLGRLQPQFFPKVFGPQGDSPLDREASRAALAALARRPETATGLPHSPEQVAAGAIAIATARMAEAINNAVLSRERHQAPWTRRLAGRTLWHRDILAVGQTLLGPALIVEATGTIVLAQGWSAQVLAASEL